MEEVDVLIIGGGGAGLTSSLLLSSYGCDTLLISKHAGTSHLPKAHLLFQKTMEIFDELGVGEAIRAQATPLENWQYNGWYAGVAGPTADYGRQIARAESWSRGYTDLNWVQASATSPANLPQIRLEPLLKAAAEDRAPGRVRFNHLLVSLVEEGDHVVATIEKRETGETYQVRARYVLGCDGGRTVGELLGVRMEGAGNLATSVNIHFKADLSRWVRDPEVLIRVILNPDVDFVGILLPMGPDHWDGRSDEWIFGLPAQAGDAIISDDSLAIERMKQVIGVPDLDPEILTISRWRLESLTAERMRVGRTFLLGDAAHRHPPSGGLGLNTAIQDAYNICWKLALVLKGKAGDALLDSYEEERKPIAQRTVDYAIKAWTNLRTVGEAIGILPTNTPEENWARVRAIWGEGPDAEKVQVQTEGVFANGHNEMNHLGLSYGYTYGASGAIVSDGTTADVSPDVDRIYLPSTRPGHPLPHAWVQRKAKKIALGELAGNGKFLLITGEDGAAWCEAADRIAKERSIEIEAIRIGIDRGDWIDIGYNWLRQRQISSDGAVLVRPDRFISWRVAEGAFDPNRQLAEVFDEILGPVAA